MPSPPDALVALHGADDDPGRLRALVTGATSTPVAAPTGPLPGPRWFDPHAPDGGDGRRVLDTALRQFDGAAAVTAVGFSQGAAMALGWVLATDAPAAVTRVVALAGWLEPWPDLDLAAAASRGVEVVLVAGGDDEVVDPVRTRGASRALERAGLRVVLHQVDGLGHDPAGLLGAVRLTA